MKQLYVLRQLLLACVLMLTGGVSSAYAQEIIWQEDWSSGSKDQKPSQVNATNYSETDNGKSITKIYAANLAGGTSPELLIGKSKGSWTVSDIDLKGYTGDFTLSYNSNNSKITVTADGKAVTMSSAGTKSYSGTFSVSTGTTKTSIVFSNTSSDNSRIDNVKLTYKVLSSVNKPTFSPLPGTYENVQNVTLSADDGHTIYYTTDGVTTPTTASTKYDGAITVSETTTIRAIAVNAEGKASDMAEGKYIITLPKSLPYEEAFSKDKGEFTTTGTTWGFSSSYMLANAYDISGKVAEDWLVSPELDLTSVSAAYLQFDHAARYFSNMPAMATVWGKIKGGDWQKLTISQYPTVGTSSTFVTATADLTALAGNIAQIAFKYESISTNCGAWEIKNVSVNAGKEPKIFEFSAEEATVTIGNTFTAPVLTNEYGGDVNYTSSNTAVATVNASTGEVSLIAAGTTIITATLAADNAVTVSYTLTVLPAPKQYLYKKITSEDEIVDGGVYLIINETGSTVMGNIVSSKGSGVSVTVDKDKCELTKMSDNDIKLLKQADGSYAIRNDVGYVGYSSKTSLASSSTLPADNNKYLWNISLSSQGNANIQNKGDNTRYIRFYSTASDFRAYTTSDGTVVQLYKKVFDAPRSITIQAENTEGYYATFSDLDNDVVFTEDYVISTVSVEGNVMSIDNLTSANYAIIDDETGEISTVKGYYVPKNSGVLVYSVDTKADFFKAVANAEATLATSNRMKAVPADGKIVAEPGYKYYKLAYGNYTTKTDLGFYWGAAEGGAFTSKKGLAYLAVPAGTSGAAPTKFVFGGDDASGIVDVQAAKADRNDVIYNLAGQRVQKAVRGAIYIVNGKKVILK